MEASLGAIWHENPRYKREPEKSFGGRVESVIYQTFFTRRPDGNFEPAYARFMAIPGSNFLSNTWRANSEADTAHAFERTGYGFAGAMGSNAFHEFWPTVKFRICICSESRVENRARLWNLNGRFPLGDGAGQGGAAGVGDEAEAAAHELHVQQVEFPSLIAQARPHKNDIAPMNAVERLRGSQHLQVLKTSTPSFNDRDDGGTRISDVSGIKVASSICPLKDAGSIGFARCKQLRAEAPMATRLDIGRLDRLRIQRPTAAPPAAPFYSPASHARTNECRAVCDSPGDRGR